MMEGQKLAKTLRYKSKADFEAALETFGRTTLGKKKRFGVEQLFKNVCGPCKDDSENVDAIVFCQNCKEYMCAECKKADEKRYRGKNKHIFISLEKSDDEAITRVLQDERKPPKESSDIPLSTETFIDQVNVASVSVNTDDSQVFEQESHAQVTDDVVEDNLTESEEADFLRKLREIDIRYEDMDDECNICDIVCLSKDDLVLADTNNNKLLVLSSTNNIRQLKLNNYPWNLAVSRLNSCEVYATLPEAKQIVLIDTGKLSIQETIKASGDCWGIVCTSNGLVVSIWDADSINGCIQMLNLNGKILKTLERDAVGKTFLNGVCYLAVDRSETMLYVTDTGNKAIQLILINKDCFKMHQRLQENTFGWISGITTGANEDLYIIDLMNICLYRLDKMKNGKYKSIALLSHEDGLVHPRCVCFDKCRKWLYVGGYTDKIRVFK